MKKAIDQQKPKCHEYNNQDEHEDFPVLFKPLASFRYHESIIYQT